MPTTIVGLSGDSITMPGIDKDLPGSVEAVTILIVGFITETLVVFLLRAPHTSEA